MTIIYLSCPEYNFDGILDIKKVSQKIDTALLDNFPGQSIVLRAVQSEKCTLDKGDLINYIKRTGVDRYETSAASYVDVSDTKIDLFGMKCIVKGDISLPILKGFHIYKPKSLERPQYKLDIWMVYDAIKLKNVEYFHKAYKVTAKDGYVFRDENNKADALIGLLAIK
jgi:hypothetical protein